MKKFMVLYLTSGSASEQMARTTPEQMKAGMELWAAWSREAAGAMVDPGMPLGNGMRVVKTGVEKSDLRVAGFSIMQAESIGTITALMAKHPHHRAPDASIEVLELLPMPGM